MVTIVNWTDVEETLARVEDALGADDANLLRAALALRGRGLTMAEYQQINLALAGDKRPAVGALAAGLELGAAKVHQLLKGDRGAPLTRALGGVLWHVAMLAADCGLPLDDVARMSVKRE